ncbi:MAG: OmpA family protein [Bacteroidetes bacterium]|nr:OmpA family protein [Bacteroidota bacterium]
MSIQYSSTISSLGLAVCLLAAPVVYSQNDTIDPDDNPQTGKGFVSKPMSGNKGLDPDSEKLIEKAKTFLFYGQENYYKGLEYFLKAYPNNTENAQLNAHIGKCYLKTGKKGSAISYFQKAYNLDQRVDPKIHYYLGRSYQMNYDFDEAVKNYELFLKNLRDSSLIREVTRNIEESVNGKSLMKNPARVFIDNLGDSVNTSYPEYNPFVTADESFLFFTSRRESTTGKKQSLYDYQFYEDIFVSEPRNGSWSKPKNIGKQVNTSTNDAVVGISLDGQKIFVYRDENGGDIYLAELKGSRWYTPKHMNKKFNTPFHESCAAFSVDQESVYFVSDNISDSSRIGGKDIYIVKKNENGRWEKPVNMGPVINTPYDETSVFVHPDGRTFFFSSKGHNSMGGYDIFKTELKEGSWSKPENLGYPINTPDDDVSFVMTANGKKGYYSSSVIGGKGDKDIYRITFLGPEKEGVLNSEDNLLALRTKPVKERIIEPKVKVREAQPTILKGIISDAVTLDLLEATIEIVDNEKNKIISTLSSNSETGKYLISLPSGKNYGIAVKKKGYLFHSENFIIPASAEYQVIYKNIELKKLDVGSIIILKNIFFDFNKAVLRPESYPELERIVKLMNEFQFITIEISGHTDNIGSAEYNQKLSEARARAVTDYLSGMQIAADRLTYAGYGFSNPVASNDSEEGRQMNRRTEFKVMRTDYKPIKTPKPVTIAPEIPVEKTDSVPTHEKPPE